MFSGVSGLRAHQTRMDVIGNNVANVNTVGFKSGRVTFSEIFSQTLRGAGAPDAATGRGGTNPMQVGLGLGVNAIDTITSRGSLQRTDNPTDVSIEGEGFFVVKGGSGDTYKFTKAGNFGIDKLGNLVTGSGLNVYGWQLLETGKTDTFDTEQPIEPINLYTDDYRNKRIIPAQATTRAILAGNLDASFVDLDSVEETNPALAKTFTVPMTVYDSMGRSYKVTLEFQKASVAGDPEDPDAEQTTTWTISVDGDNTVSGDGENSIDLVFDRNGRLTPASAAATRTLTIIPDESSGTAAFDINLDLTKVTMYAADCSVKPTNIDGYTMGNLVTFNVGSDGIITGIYDNGQQQALGQLCLATFENPAGLQKAGDNLYLPTTNSGEFKKGVKPGADGAGTLNPGTLEMSNVDLSKEFTDMIVTQRGFQANSRIITTSDEMLQELVNLKR